MLVRMMRGRLFWTILGLIAGAYYIRSTSSSNRRSRPMKILTRQGQRSRNGWSSSNAIETAARAGRAAWEGARKVVQR